MKDFDEAPRPGCTVCNSDLLRSHEEIVAERRDEISPRMHIAKMGDGYHILEIPGVDGKPFQAWQGPFESRAAASLYLEDLIDEWAHGSPEGARSSRGILDHFNLAGRLLPMIEKHPGDHRRLAIALAACRPWERPAAEDVDDELPF